MQLLFSRRRCFPYVFSSRFGVFSGVFLDDRKISSDHSLWKLSSVDTKIFLRRISILIAVFFGSEIFISGKEEIRQWNGTALYTQEHATHHEVFCIYFESRYFNSKNNCIHKYYMGTAFQFT